MTSKRRKQVYRVGGTGAQTYPPIWQLDRIKGSHHVFRRPGVPTDSGSFE